MPGNRDGRAPRTTGGGGAGAGRGGQVGRVPLRLLEAPRLPQPSPAQPRPTGALTASPGPGWGRAHRPLRPHRSARMEPRRRAGTGSCCRAGGVPHSPPLRRRRSGAAGRRRGPSAAEPVDRATAGRGRLPRMQSPPPLPAPAPPHHSDDRRGVGRGACREGSGVPRPRS